MRNAKQILVGMPQGNKPLRRSRYRWEGYIKMNLKIQNGGCGLDLSHSGWKLVGICNTTTNFEIEVRILS
jgi:hypothetical protein